MRGPPWTTGGAYAVSELDERGGPAARAPRRNLGCFAPLIGVRSDDQRCSPPAGGRGPKGSTMLAPLVPRRAIVAGVTTLLALGVAGSAQAAIVFDGSP